MADSLYELLAPHLIDEDTATASHPPSSTDQTTLNYLARLTTLSLDAISSTEAASLSQSAHSTIRSIQALSKRSHKSVINANDSLSNLSTILSSLTEQSKKLEDGIPPLEGAASEFAKKYERNTDNAVLDRRKKALLLSRNVDRVGNILDLPSLLSTTIGSSTNSAGGTASGAAASGYASALDIHAHVKRLRALYPDSILVKDICAQSDQEIENLITILITSLQSQGLKLAGAMRTIGWLRRIAPDLANSGHVSTTSDANRSLDLRGIGSEEGSLGALFLVCRLVTLKRMLDALEPLRELADQESERRNSGGVKDPQQRRATQGTQSERYLKRYIEIFREQSFSIVSMYKSVFPSALPVPAGSGGIEESLTSSTNGVRSSITSMRPDTEADAEAIVRSPSALSTFAPHLVDMLIGSVREYMPNVTDRSSRDSLLTQVLYCAGSLGRLGADFGMMLAVLEDELAEQDDNTARQTLEPVETQEWVQVMKKHRVQASRLELLASGVGSGRKNSGPADLRSPPAMTSAS